MVFEHIEKLKREFTDKYVVVDASRAELQRFDGQTGLIKTVNMNGRALVEFDGFANIGWYDISLDCLRVVDKPVEKEEPKAKKAPPKKTAAKAEKPAAKKEAGKPAGGPPKMSVADMLAAARGEKSDGGPAAAAKPASPTPKAAPAATKGSGSMSVAEMLAAARAEKSGEAAPPAEEVPATPAATAPDPEPPAEAPAEEQSTPEKGDLPTETAEICAYCRAADGS